MWTAHVDLNLVTWTWIFQVPFADSLGVSTGVPENRLKALFWDFDQVTWRLVEGFLSPLILHIVLRTPWNVLSTCLYTGFACCSQDPGLGTCLDRQSWARLAAKICLLCVSDFSPWISQNLGLLWGSQELSHPSVHTFLSMRQDLMSAPTQGWDPWCLWGRLAGGAKGTRHPQSGVCVFWAQASREGTASSVLWSENKEKSGRAHIHQME